MGLKKRIVILLSCVLVLTSFVPVYAEEAVYENQKVQEEIAVQEVAPVEEDSEEKVSVTSEEDTTPPEEDTTPLGQDTTSLEADTTSLEEDTTPPEEDSNPEITFEYDKESYVYPDPVTIKAYVDGALATPSDVTWYVQVRPGERYYEQNCNPLVIPATVPNFNIWNADIMIGEQKYTVEVPEINITEPKTGMIVSFDNQPVYPGTTVTATSLGGSGSVSLSEDGLTAKISNVSLAIDSMPDVSYIAGKLTMHGSSANTYNLIFEGDSDFGYEESPSEESRRAALIAHFAAGSTVKIQSSDPGRKVNLAGTRFDFQEIYGQGSTTKITKFFMQDIAMTAYSCQKVPLKIYCTFLECTNCDITAKAFDNQSATEFGMVNQIHDESEELIWFKDCNIDLETDYARAGNASGSTYRSPSVFNSVHYHVLFDHSDTVLKLDHTTQGQCRGIFMLSGEVTIDGGTMDILVDCPIEDINEGKTERQIMAAAIQAVSFKAQNDACVNAAVRNVPRDSWGIIYAQNVLIEGSKVNLDIVHQYEGVYTDLETLYNHAYGSCTQGIYYYGSSSLMKENNIVPEDENQLSIAELEAEDNHARVGNVVIQDSEVDIKLEGISYNYTTCGISGRYVRVDNSDIAIDIETKESPKGIDQGFSTAFIAFNFHNDADIKIDGARIVLPSDAHIQIVNKSPTLETEFYSVIGAKTGDVAEDVIIERSISPQHKSSGTVAKTLFTGTPGNPVTNGTWKVNADGTWSFVSGQIFTNTWAYIRYTVNGAPIDSWFWFDKSGRMLTGWHKLYWNGKLNWYYFNEKPDGTLGACLIGPAWTPDGYEVDANGAWTGKKR